MKKKLKISLLASSLLLPLFFSTSAYGTEHRQYEDIAQHWAADQIMAIHNQGFLFPVDKPIFQPDQKITRAEFVSMLVKALHLEGEVSPSFTDVSLTKWYARDIYVAKEHQLVKGGVDGLFRPEEPITRAEIAALIRRGFNHLEPNRAGSAFVDVAAEHWAYHDIQYVSQIGVVRGYEDQMFKPSRHLTRAEAAVMVYRILTKEEKAPVLSLATQEILAEPANVNLTYQVQKGDSLWKISQTVGAEVESLIQLNSLETDQLQVGQVLQVPSTATVAYTPSVDLAYLFANQEIEDNSRVASRGDVELLPWTAANQLFSIGKQARITDVYTGKAFYIKRNYGVNHADVEPLTSADTQTMNEIWGGSTWDTRPIIVEVEGRRLAAAMHNMPHSIQQIMDNDYDGHTCIHFLGSTKHKDGEEWPSMQRDVQIAANRQ